MIRIFNSFSTNTSQIFVDLPLSIIKAANELLHFRYSEWLEISWLNVSLTICEIFAYWICLPSGKKNQMEYEFEEHGAFSQRPLLFVL